MSEEALKRAFAALMPAFKEEMVEDLVKAMKFGAKTERAAIVAWLRNERLSYTSADWIADAIEAGDHLKGGF